MSPNTRWAVLVLAIGLAGLVACSAATDAGQEAAAPTGADPSNSQDQAEGAGGEAASGNPEGSEQPGPAAEESEAPQCTHRLCRWWVPIKGALLGKWGRGGRGQVGVGAGEVPLLPTPFSQNSNRTCCVSSHRTHDLHADPGGPTGSQGAGVLKSRP
jgi:hypothetical protein